MRQVTGTRPRGSFKIANQRRAFELFQDPLAVAGGHRVRRILASIHADLHEGGIARIRQILANPRELYRIELERPDLSYQRTTVLDRETLEVLIEETPEHVLKERFHFRTPLPSGL